MSHSGRSVAVPWNDQRPLPAYDLDHVLRHTQDLWEDLRGAHLFVTGGTGFFGRWMLESFLHANQELALGARARVVSRNVPAFSERAPHVAENTAIELVQADIRSFDAAHERFTHVLHMAAETNTQLTFPPAAAYYDVIVRGTERVVDLAAACGARRLLLVSSGAVYGTQPQGIARIAEDAPFAPRPDDLLSAYGQAKRCAEFLAFAKTENTGPETSVARCFAFVGPGLPLDSGFAVGNFIADALTRRRIVIRGDGTPRRSYMYAGDLAIWLWTILVRGERGRPYNVGSDEELSIARLAHTVAGLVEPPADVVLLGDEAQRGVGGRYVPDVDRARSELRLALSYGMEDALARTIDWHRPGATA